MPQYLQKFMGQNSLRPIPGYAPVQDEGQGAQQSAQPVAAAQPAPAPSMPSIDQIVNDQDFIGLPASEKAKVLMSIDPDFSKLPEGERMRAVEMMGSPSQSAGAPNLMASHENTIPQESTFTRTMKGATRTLEPIYRPVLEGGGAAAGSILGAGAGIETGPGAVLTGAAGGALGYAIGKETADALDMYSGSKQPYRSVGEMAKTTAEDLATGAMLDVGGQLFTAALVPTVRGAKYVFKRGTEGVKNLISRSSMKEQAGKVLMAHTSEGPIFAANAKQAAEIEKQIPGLKFSLGQRTNDPNLIKLERASFRKPGKAAETMAEQIARNNEALAAYYEKNFGGKEGIDDLISSLQKTRQGLQQQSESASGAVSNMAESLPKKTMSETGQEIRGAIESEKIPVKSAMGQLEESIPDYPMKFSNTKQAITDILASRKISISQRRAVELAQKNIDLILEGGSSTHSAFGVRRTINDQISKAFKNGNDSIGASLMKVKAGIDSDLADVAAMARTGKIAEYKGSYVNPDELASTMEMNAREIAKTKGLDRPDVNTMSKELNARGVPTMRQLRETDEGYTGRISRDYERIMEKPVPMVENTNEVARISRLSARNEEIKKILSEVSPGQDVASSMKAYNDFASTEYFGRFDKGYVKSVMEKGSQASGKKMASENVSSKFTTETGAQDLIRAIGKENAGQIMRGHYAYDMMLKSTDPTGKIKSSALAKWYQSNKNVLEKYGIKEEFNNIQMAQKVADQAAAVVSEFEKSAAARVLNADPERAIANAIKGNNAGKAASELLKMTEGDAAATAGLKKAFADHIREQITTTATDIAGNKIVSNAAFQRNLAKYEPAIKALYKNEPQKMKALDTMRRAYEVMVRNAKSPIGGGSDTAENMITGLADVVHVSTTVSAVKSILKLLGKYSKTQVDELVTDAFFNPQFAEELIASVKGNIRPQDLKTVIDGKIIQLDSYRASRLKAAAAGGAAMLIPKNREK